MIPTYTIDVSHLNWSIIQHGHRDEDPEIELHHDCIYWCEANNMTVIFKAEQNDAIWGETSYGDFGDPYKVFAVLENIEDTTLFTLRWSEREK